MPKKNVLRAMISVVATGLTVTAWPAMAASPDQFNYFSTFNYLGATCQVMTEAHGDRVTIGYSCTGPDIWRTRGVTFDASAVMPPSDQSHFTFLHCLPDHPNCIEDDDQTGASSTGRSTHTVNQRNSVALQMH